ncbi:MAG: hypothetical protein HY236_08085 [Acidobacteria bacterium]|nr:hypothetical protein [Acidobacteriota bacterium]
MHLQQTKRGSRDTGGPQYYFHDLTKAVKTYLRLEGAVPVALTTPYGGTKSEYFAVGKDHKLDADLRPVPGNVGHDRVQQGRATESIGESIRKWYGLPAGDFERIRIEVEIRDDAFWLSPLAYKTVGGKEKEIRRIDRPLTFTLDYASPLWTDQLRFIDKREPRIVSWALAEICRIAADHRPSSKLPHIQESDILRASGPLKHLGMSLGGYVGKGYDCVTEFSFLRYPSYKVPVELKRNSRDFKYQQQKYGKDLLSRAVVLCAIHEHIQLPPSIDVIELEALCRHSSMLASR